MIDLPTPYELVVASLAVFRAARMISKESGPAWIFARLRRAVPKSSSAKEGIECPYCLGAQASLLVTLYFFTRSLLPGWAQAGGDFLLVAFAIAGAEVLVHQAFTWLRRE